MTREQLEHAIRAACDVADDTELYVFGSQAILGSFPNAPDKLCTSIEVDVQPKNKPELTDAIDRELGELSRFNETHGFYVHGVAIEAATLPSGWESRTVPVYDNTNGNTGYCLEVYDLAASKLFASRPKDRIFVSTLLVERLISPEIFIQRIAGMTIEKDRISDMANWVKITAAEINEAG